MQGNSRVANFSHLFRWKYAIIIQVISDLIDDAENSRTSKLIEGEQSRDAKPQFKQLKRAFTNVPSLDYFILPELIILQTDRSQLVITSSYNRYDDFRFLRLIASCCQKCPGTTQNTDSYHHWLLAND